MIDFNRKPAGIPYVLLGNWYHGMHEVALVRESGDSPHAGTVPARLVCECDFPEKVPDGGQTPSGSDPPPPCLAKAAVAARVVKETVGRIGDLGAADLLGYDAAVAAFEALRGQADLADLAHRLRLLAGRCDIVAHKARP